MLDFVVEWHDAPGVKDAVLAKTWGDSKSISLTTNYRSIF